MEERLAQKQPEGTSGEDPLDSASVASLLDWSCTDLDDTILAGGDESSPQFVLESQQDADQNEEAAATLSSETHNKSAIEIEAQSGVPTAVMCDMASTAAVPSLPDLLHSDRDQLYFDRVHTFYPILHEHRYYSWSHDCLQTDAQVCLQQTMWALATSASTQPQSVGDMLYHGALQRLEELEAKENAHQQISIMQVQAWLLLAFYEFMRVDFRRGWMSAGHAFRLIQLMRLHELDLSDITLTAPAMDWVDKEEQRRTFWLAYSLDRFISLSNGSPLTLGEQFAVRMPAPNVNFQSGQPFVMNILSDVMLGQDTNLQDSFTEFVIMATICGRALSHRQQSMAWMINSDPVQIFWDRHQQINADLAPRIVALALNHPPVTTHTNPLLLFTHAMAQTLVLYMYRLMSEILPASDETNQGLMNESSRSFNRALVEVLSLSKTLSQVSCFKGGGVFEEQVKVISNALNSLKRINILGQQSRLGKTEASRDGDMEDLSLQTSEALELLTNF
ncbi:MAG: hypothetical protein L6R38_002299 [Xanthoria sp. 2 TBL-2021]|nr:MAG: hypothetical protein L6R38_002299 [Xanthoria sp. 2 TBL-2021]